MTSGARWAFNFALYHAKLNSDMEEFSEQQVNGPATILDESNKLTVAPLHDEAQIVAEPTNAEIANAHANGPAIANIEGDIESTTTEVKPPVAEKTAHERADELIAIHKANAPAAKSHKLLPYVSAAVVAIMAGLLLFFVLFR